jgi:hypothetical protein
MVSTADRLIPRVASGDATDVAALPMRWLGLAVGSLVISGCFSLMLVAARMPPFDQLVTDPLFFRRALVVHVDLALIVWFYAWIGALSASLPGRHVAGPAGFALSALGVAMLIVGGLFTEGAPVLANYVPVVDTPLFLLGLVAFGAGLMVQLIGPRLLPWGDHAGTVAALPPAARTGVRAAMWAVLAAGVTFTLSVAGTDPTLEPALRFELIAWGGGHLLQFASTAAMLAVWVALTTPKLGRWGHVLFAALVAPALLAPLLAVGGTHTAEYRVGFTRLMQFGIFPVVLVFVGVCGRALAQRLRAMGPQPLDVRTTGFVASAALAIVGFVLGALIRGSNTMVPAHYHASIGAVSAALMAMTWLLLRTHGVEAPAGRAGRWVARQPLVYAVGQMVFAAGFGMAGAGGMARKAFGAEQAVRTPLETAGLVVMGTGGLVAVAGGLLFLGLVIRAWRHHTRRTL